MSRPSRFPTLALPLAALLCARPCTSSAQLRAAATSVPAGTVPGGINYQGRLIDNGFPVTATRSMTFRLYDAATNGNLLWSAGPQSVAVSQGIFGATLAISTSALSGPLQKYLEVQVDNTTLAPREPLSAVPYALIAKSLEENLSISSVSVASSLISSGTLSAAGISALAGNPGVSVTTSVFITGGFLGVGTSSPNARLHIAGTPGVDGIRFPDGSLMTSAGVGSATLLTNAGDALIQADSGNTGTGAVRLRTGAVDKVYVANGGNVGLGTSAPAATLDVNGSAQFGSGAVKSTFTASGSLSVPGTVTAGSFSGNGAGLTGVIGSDPSRIARAGDAMTGPLAVAGSSLTVVDVNAGDLYSLAVTSASNRSIYHLAVATNGYVGIGTASPAGKLTVQDGDIRISTSPSAPSRGIIFQDGSVQTSAAGTGAGAWAASGANIYNTNAGNLGVGTTTPGSLLEVAGNMAVKGPLPWIDVRAYGAVGDDATDNATAFTNALAALPSGGGTIFIPPGIYRVSGALAVLKDNVKIVGAGWGATTVRTTSPSSDVFDLGDGVTGRQNLSISDMKIDSTVSKSAGAGVAVKSAIGARLFGLRIETMYYGIQIQNSVIVDVTDVHMRNMTPATGVGVYVDGGNDHFLTNVIMDNPPGSQPLAGVDIVNSDATWMLNDDFIHSGYGLLMNPPAGKHITWCFIMNSAFDTNANDGIFINPAAGSTVYGTTFTGDWTATNSGQGVRFGTTGTIDGMHFIGHRSFNNSQNGFLLGGGANTQLQSVFVSGNSQASAGTYHGIAVAAGVSQFDIRNSRSGQAAGFGNTQGWGLLINAGASNNYVVVGNDLTGNATGGFSDGGTGTSKQTSGNLPAAGETQAAFGGKVGVGTASPFQQLDVVAQSGTGLASDVGFRVQDGNASTPKSLKLGINTTGNGYSYAQSTFEGTAHTPLALNPLGGGVGVGTTNPASKLTVQDGDIRISTSPSASSRGIIFQDGSVQTSAAGTGATSWSSSGSNIYNSNSGNLGVGTSSPAQKLDVNGVIQTEGTRFVVNGFDGTGTHWFKTGAAEPGSVFLAISTNAAGNANVVQLAPGGGPGLAVNAAGSVGVGTASPGTKLDVNGMIRGTNFTGPQDGQFGVYVDTGFANGSAIQLYGAAGAPANTLAFLSGSPMAERMRVTSAGYVGIGTTGPTYPLEVVGNGNPARFASSAAGSGNIRFDNTGAATPGTGYVGMNAFANGLFGLGTPAASNLPVAIFSNGAAVATFTAAGFVGVGTPTPTQLLEVRGSNAANFGTTTSCCGGGLPTLGLSEATSSNGRAARLQFHDAGFQEAFMQLSSNTRVFQFGDDQNNGVDLAIFNPAFTTSTVYLSGKGVSYFSGGNVGVGTIAPGDKLEVAGGSARLKATAGVAGSVKLFSALTDGTGTQACAAACGASTTCLAAWTSAGATSACATGAAANRCLCSGFGD